MLAYNWIANFALSIPSGVIGGFVANYFYRKAQHTNKPNIVVSENIIKAAQDGYPVLRVKLINKTLEPIVDIEILFYGIEYLDQEKKLKHIRPIASYAIPFIQEYDKNDPTCDFAYRAALKPIDKSSNIHDKLVFDDYLLFIKATNSYNNTIQATYHKYSANAILDHCWHFDVGDTTNAQKRSDIKDLVFSVSLKDKDKISNVLSNCPFANITTS